MRGKDNKDNKDYIDSVDNKDKAREHLSPETSTLPAPQSPQLACQDCLAAEGQDAGRGGRENCDARESERVRDVMARTGSGCGVKEKPLAAGKEEGAGG